MYANSMIYITSDRIRIIIDDEVLDVDEKLRAVFIDGSQLRRNGRVLNQCDADIIAAVAEMTDIGLPPIAVFTTADVVRHMAERCDIRHYTMPQRYDKLMS